MALRPGRHQVPEQGTGSIVASAKRVDLRARRETAALARLEDWQERAWGYYDSTPEVKFSTNYVGNVMSKVRLFLGVLSDDGTEVIPVADPDSKIPADWAAKAQAELDRLKAPIGGQGQIVSGIAKNVDVAGEAYLIGWGEYDEQHTDPSTQVVTDVHHDEEWEVRSVSEVSGTGDEIKVGDGQTTRTINKDRDTIIRVWVPHPRFAGRADSLLSAVLDDCELLDIIEAQMRAEHRSRHGAGALTFPNELSVVPRTGTPTDPSPPADGQAAATEDPLVTSFYDGMGAAVDNVNDPASWAPFLLRGPAKFLTEEFVRHLPLSRKSGPELDARHERVCKRVARGINLPPEIVMGHQETTFANAAQVDKNTWKDYLEPRALLVVDTLTVGFMHPNMLDDAADPISGKVPDEAKQIIERIVVWYDPSALLPLPDLAEAADVAWDRGEISSEAYLRIKGFDPNDAASVLEKLQRAGLRRGILTADLTLALLNLFGQPIDVQPIPAAMPQPVGADGELLPTADAAPAAAGFLDNAAQVVRQLEAIAATGSVTRATAARRAAPGRQLMELDRELRSRLLTATDAAMSRALERAGNRMRSKASASRATLRALPARSVCARMGREAVTAAGLTDDDLLDGAWDELHDQFMSWGARAQHDAVSIVNRVVGGFSQAERDALGLRQAESLDQAWQWLEGTLRSLASARLYDPLAGVTDAGEIAESLSIPPGMIRSAVAQAGGAAGLETSGTGNAFVTVAQAGTAPVGGIGTGDAMLGVLREHGVSIEAYQWVYGPGQRRTQFEPHVELDGVVFENFDDDQLANSGGFPEFAYYLPGDHGGCQCDLALVLIDGDGNVLDDSTPASGDPLDDTAGD